MEREQTLVMCIDCHRGFPAEQMTPVPFDIGWYYVCPRCDKWSKIEADIARWDDDCSPTNRDAGAGEGGGEDRGSFSEGGNE